MADLMGMFKETLKEARLEFLKEKNDIDWIDDKEAKELLSVKSKSKMQQLRSQGEVVLTKYGKKIKYSKKSILAILNRNTR